MNRRMVFHTVGLIVLLEAGMLLLPLGVSLFRRDGAALPFLFSIVTALAVGSLLYFTATPRNRVIFAKEGFAITTLAWLFLSAIGALPFFFSQEIPHYVDALFETVSGFTTTGASILPDVAVLSPSLLFWRSFTHWIGGMGVLVFLTAVLSNLTDRSIHIIRAEMPGPTVGKLLPRTKDTAKILYLIYVGMTLVMIALLWGSGMTLFESAVHTFGTAGTGGFGIYSSSAAGFTPAQQWIITVFMLLFGVNFNLYYLILIRRFRTALRSSELWVYFAVVALASAVLIFNSYELFDTLGEAIRHAIFQVSSVITTTGYTTLDFNLLPNLSKTVLLLLMFLGACAGSTGGGFKVSRVILLIKNCRAEVRHLVHPRSVNVLRYEGKKVEKETQKGVMSYFCIYVFIFLATFLLISLDGFDIETSFSAAAACFNNIGPAFGSAYAGYFDFSIFSKLILSLSMLLGRLEIWPILVCMMPTLWFGKRNKKRI